MSLFIEIALIIVFTVLVAGLAHYFKQPLIVGYIVAGFILTFITKGTLATSNETLQIFSEMGIAILLFIVGLHLSPRELKDFGLSSFLIGLFQVSFTSIIGFIIAYFSEFTSTESMFIGLAVSLSSTIVVLKIISDKKDLEKLYARLAIGILLLQDIVASIALIFVSAFGSGNAGVATFTFIFIKGLILFPLMFLVGKYVLPRIGKFFATSQEFLLLFSLGWGFGIAALFYALGFSIEIGALVAGVSLSMSPYSAEISSRLRPLRDFFVVMFFVSLGAQVSFESLGVIWPAIIVFSIFVLMLKPLIIMVLLSLFKYNKKTGFFDGVSLAQISEFSLILILLGFNNGQVSQAAMSLIIFTGIITIAVSSYLLTYIEYIYPLIASHLKILDKSIPQRETSISVNHEVILFGCNRVGYDFIKAFKEMGNTFLAVDFDPQVVALLQASEVNCMYGDAEDGEFLDQINVDTANVVISTIPEYETSVFLLSKIRATNPKSLVIMLCYNIEEALILYEKGASYVILPHFISGEFAANLALKAGKDPSKLHRHKKDHIDYLKGRKQLGHSHPVWSHHY